MRDGDGFILCYDITVSDTYDQMDIYREKLLRVYDEDTSKDSFIPVVYVGLHNYFRDESQRVISVDKGKELVSQWGGNCAFFEVNPKEDVNVEQAFHECVRAIWKKNGQRI
eukprot:36600_1